MTQYIRHIFLNQPTNSKAKMQVSKLQYPKNGNIMNLKIVKVMKKPIYTTIPQNELRVSFVNMSLRQRKILDISPNNDALDVPGIP